MTATRDGKAAAPEAQLRSWIGRLEPEHQKLFRAVRTAIRKRFPTANELGYDYTSSVIIGYSPTDRGIDSVVAIAGRETGVSLYFSQGPRLPDPKGMLRGKGKQVRYIQLDSARQLEDPDVERLIALATDQAKIPLPSRGKGALILKSTAGKKRPGRKATK